MKKDDRIYLVHMLEIAQRIAARVTHLSRAEFDANEDVQLALTHLLQTIGEAARLVTESTRSQVPQVPWRLITGMRHRLVHDYLRVNLDVVWDTSHESVRQLIDQLEAALKVVGDPRSSPLPPPPPVSGAGA